MTQERVQRRLAAIMAADVVGYSRLMRADEAGTLARAEVEALLSIDPNYSLRQLAGFATYRDPAVRRRLLDLLRDAGLPE